MSVINATPLLAAAGGDYQISRSVRLRSSASAYFNRTPASAGNRKTWTWSGWVKRGALGGASGKTFLAAYVGSGTVDTSFFFLGFNTSDQLTLTGYSTVYRTTSAVYRDPSSWYHVVVSVDTTQATASNRFRVYVNGIEVTAFGTSNNPAQNTDLGVNQASAHYQGFDFFSSYLDGYLTEVNFIDGQTLTPSSFGETDSITGVWKPKKYAGTYGTNGFYLNFSDNSAATAAAIGKDNSGNGNNWTPNNISVTSGVTYDSMLDVPTLYADGGNGRGNYCTLNPLMGGAGKSTTSNGNLTATSSSGGSWPEGSYGSIAVASGKWYCEITPASGSTAAGAMVGVIRADLATSRWYYNATGNKYTVTTNDGAYGAAYTDNDVIGVALDMDAGTVTFYKNGTSQGQAYSGLTGEWVFGVCDASGGATVLVAHANFGQRPFAYTPPTGFVALNTQNLPEPTIKKGNQYFDATVYAGTGSAQSVVNSGGFQPDLVWGKSRTSGVWNHVVVDSVRGATTYLNTNTTGAENTNSTVISAINSNGFSVGTDVTLNTSGSSNVGWQWKKGATPGFDIVTYTGTGSALTVNHSLGVAPAFIITKTRGAAGYNWFVYHKDLGATKGLNLDLTGAAGTTSGYWNNTAPTSTQFTVGSFAPAATQVAYLFAEVAGFSKFGSYTGNGSADGPFVFTGFRPRYVLIKASSAAGTWTVWDSARSTANSTNLTLAPNNSNAEGTSINIDFLSNGFKVRHVGDINVSGVTSIFAAFAENPFKNSLAR